MELSELLARLDTAYAAARQQVDAIGAVLQQYRDEQVTTLPSGSHLAAAVERGGVIRLAANGTYEGTVTFRTPSTHLIGAPGARVIGVNGPAIQVAPGVHTIVAEGFEALAPGYSEAVVRLGDNGPTQVSLDAEPHDIVLSRVTVPTHRGKRAFEVNARRVTLNDCHARDVWSSNVDTQGIAVLNSSGLLRVYGGEYHAGSNPFLAGGDTVKLLGPDGRPLTPTDIRCEGVTFTRPLEWRTDGVNRRVKNLFEVKNGQDVTARDCRLSNNWRAAQPGEAVLFTPTRGGVVRNVVMEDSVIQNISACLNITGRHKEDYTPLPTSVTFRRNRVLMDRSFAVVNAFAKVGAGPDSVTLTDNLLQAVSAPGDILLEYYRGDVMREDGTTTTNNRLGALVMRGNALVCGRYAIRLNGHSGGGVNGAGMEWLSSHTVTGNTFGGDTIISYQRQNFPNNTYLSRAAFDAAHPWGAA